MNNPLNSPVYYLNDPEKMAEFYANHNRIGEMNRDELIEMIVIYNQWVLALIDANEQNRKEIEKYFIEFNKIIKEYQ